MATASTAPEFEIVRNDDGTLTRKDCLDQGTLYRIEKQGDGWHMLHRSDAHPEWMDWGRTFLTEEAAIRYMAWGMTYPDREPRDAHIAAADAFLSKAA